MWTRISLGLIAHALLMGVAVHFDLGIWRGIALILAPSLLFGLGQLFRRIRAQSEVVEVVR